MARKKGLASEGEKGSPLERAKDTPFPKAAPLEREPEAALGEPSKMERPARSSENSPVQRQPPRLAGSTAPTAREWRFSRVLSSEAGGEPPAEKTLAACPIDPAGCQFFLDGRVIANFDIEKAGLLRAFGAAWGRDAKSFAENLSIQLRAFAPHRKVWVPDNFSGCAGLIAMVLNDGQGDIGIEIGRAGPKRKSLAKLGSYFSRWVIVMRQTRKSLDGLSPEDQVAGMVALLTKQVKKASYPRGIENKKTIASRYRRLDMQRAVLRGEIALPKKGKK